MMLWAILGVMLVFNFGIGRQHNIPWAERLNWLALASWAIVATLAMLLTTSQSVSALRRLGWFGFRRPRWWFELGRATWNVATIAIVGVLLGLFMTNQQRQFLDPVLAILYTTFRITAPAFLLFATIGYLVSFALRLPRRGRAYDCVNYFYSVSCSLGLVTYAAIRCPPNPGAVALAIWVTLATVGVLWFVLGFISIVRRFERWEQHRHAA